MSETLGLGPTSAAALAGAPAVLEMRAISVRFGGVNALSNVSLRVPAASALGVIGPNGAGKTTLLNVASGFVRPSAGEVDLNGTNITSLNATRRALAGLGRTFQTPRPFPGLTVGENLLVVSRRSRRGSPYSIDEALELAGVPGLAELPVERLEAGERRFVELARCLMLNPAALLLDEPATGLRDAEVGILTRCLNRLVAERGLSALVISHDMRVIHDACSEVVVLDRGVVLAEGTPGEVRDNPAVIEAYFGTGLDT